MTDRAMRYDLLAGLFDYPEHGDYRSRIDRCIEALQQDHADEAIRLKPLREAIGEMNAEEIQELYTRTFDINPVCTLEVGWHIYGEDYARGAFLVRMRQELRARRLPESSELPDHLTHVLVLLGRMTGEQADELASRYLLPSLDKMLAGMAEKESPYISLLETVARVVRADHDVEAITPRERRADPPGWKRQLQVYGTDPCASGASAGCSAGAAHLASKEGES